jgi:hypothetical protein
MAHLVRTRRTPWHLILIFFLLSLGILGIGYFYYDKEQAYLKHEKLNELAAIANLKVKQIVDWRKERLADATTIKEDLFFAFRVNEWLKGRNSPGLKDEILQRLKALLVYQYQNIVLLDSQGRVLLSVLEYEQPVTSHTKALAFEAMQTRKTVFSDLYRSEADQHSGAHSTLPRD